MSSDQNNEALERLQKYRDYESTMIFEAHRLDGITPLSMEVVRKPLIEPGKKLTQQKIEEAINGDDTKKSSLIYDERFHPTPAQSNEFLNSGSRVLALALARKQGIELTSENVDRLLSNFGEFVKYTTIGNMSIKLNSEQAERCLNDDNPHVTIALAARGDIDFTSKQKDRLLSDPLYLVRRAAAEHIKDFTPAQLDTIVNDADALVRKSSLRFIEDLKPEQIHKLVNDPESEVRKSLALSIKNPSPEILDKLINDPSPEVRLAAVSLVKNPTPEQMEKGVYDSNIEVAKAWASLPYTPPTSQLDRWMKLVDDRVLLNLIQNPEVRFTKRQVQNLLSTDNSDVLKSLLENPECNKYVGSSALEKIMNGRNRELGYIAKSELQRRAVDNLKNEREVFTPGF